jgi:hypothetical protein
VLGVNSAHHGGGQELVNYREILHVLDLAQRSGLPEHRVPFICRGADVRLSPPASGNWYDTEPEVSGCLRRHQYRPGQNGQRPSSRHRHNRFAAFRTVEKQQDGYTAIGEFTLNDGAMEYQASGGSVTTFFGITP